jgi:hypothetical protein
MHIWINKSIARSLESLSPSKHLSKRPKGISDEQWREIVRDFKLSKLIMMDAVPKVSKKDLNISNKKERR